MYWVFLSTVLIVVTTPFLVYLSCKLGSYGILKGRHNFHRDNPVTPDLRTMRDLHEQEK